MINEFKKLESAIFHINDKGTIKDKKELLNILKHKLELQNNLIKCIKELLEVTK